MKLESKEIIYMHLQASERFVVSSGVSFQEFGESVSEPLSNLLLLQHGYEGGAGGFNMNTLMDFVLEEEISRFLKEDVHGYGNFCWVDFEEEQGLDELNGQDIAELLYLAHCKTHLHPPFFHQLNNRFAYLARDDGWFNKTYYRSLGSYYEMFGNLIPLKLDMLRTERNWLGFKKKNEIAPVPSALINSLSPMLAEGAVFSFHKARQPRSKIEIPIWLIGDFVNMDDMMDAYEERLRTKPDASLIYQRKTYEWSAVKN